MINSSDIADSIAAKAKEVAAAMTIYSRLPAQRSALAASAALLIEDMRELIERLETENGQG